MRVVGVHRVGGDDAGRRAPASRAAPGRPAISFCRRPPPVCASATRGPLPKTVTRWSAERPAARSKSRRNVLPSMATTPSRRHRDRQGRPGSSAPKAAGSSRRKTRLKVSWLGKPFLSLRNSRSSESRSRRTRRSRRSSPRRRPRRPARSPECRAVHAAAHSPAAGRGSTERVDQRPCGPPSRDTWQNPAQPAAPARPTRPFLPRCRQTRRNPASCSPPCGARRAETLRLSQLFGTKGEAGAALLDTRRRPARATAARARRTATEYLRRDTQGQAGLRPRLRRP